MYQRVDGQTVNRLSQGGTRAPPPTADSFPRVPPWTYSEQPALAFAWTSLVTYDVFVTDVCAQVSPMAQGVGGPFTLLVREGGAIGMRMSVIRLQGSGGTTHG